MGSLTIGLMEEKELTITQMQFTDAGQSNSTIVVSVANTGTTDVTIAIVKVNGDTMTQTGSSDVWAATGSATVVDGGTETITITTTVTAGAKYSVNLFTTEGTLIGSYTATA
jgi:hypothetical protein